MALWICAGALASDVRGAAAQATATTEPQPADDADHSNTSAARALRGYFSLTGLTARPFGGARSPSDWGYGLAFSFGASWGKIPLCFGMDLMLARWGSITRERSVDLGDQVARARLTHSDQSVFYDVWLRVQPPDLRVRPYAEVVIGFKGLFTEYSLGFEQGVGVTSTTSDQDLASSAGFGAGIEIFLVDNDASGRLYATLGFRWLHGGKASFDRSFVGPDAGTRSANFNVPTTTTVVILGIAATWDLLGKRDEAAGYAQP